MPTSLEAFQPGGFLAAALGRAARLTDAPREFHIFTSLTVLGAACHRVRITYGRRQLSPSLWLVLVAPTASFRKTTALDIAHSLLAAARPSLAPPPVYRTNRLLHSLRDTEKLLVAEDFSALLPTPVAERLIEIADAALPLSLLASATTHLLAARLVATDIAAGLLPRFSFVCAPRNKDTWRSTPGAPVPEIDEPLARFLRAASAISSTASFAACRAEHNAWGENACAFIRKFPTRQHGFLASGFHVRLQATLLKLAVLLEIAGRTSIDELRALATRPRLDVSPESFNKAAQLAGYLRASFARLLDDEIREANAFSGELRVMNMLGRSPGITRPRLMRNSHLSAETLREVLQRLEGRGHIAIDGNRVYPSARANGEAIPNGSAVPTSRFAQNHANGYPAESTEVKQ